ncbi:MAG: phosphotransferase enzyme family protein, partial [Thermomicrobiales bacterium]
ALHWVDGDHLARLPEPDEAAMIGEALGRCHAVAASWTPPAGFRRPMYDAAWFQQATGDLLHFQDGTLGESDRRLVVDAVDRACDILNALSSATGETGMIHGDPHDGNLVFGGEPPRAGLIDFARCGFGCFALDLAMAQHYVDEASWEPMIAGYRLAAPLSEAAEAALAAFRLLALIDNLATLSGIPGERQAILADLPDLLRQAWGKV